MNDAKKPVIDRISRIEGQLRGIRSMVETERPCHEIVKQVMAAAGALRSLTLVILEHHLQECVDDAVQGQISRDELVARLLEVYSRVSA